MGDMVFDIKRLPAGIIFLAAIVLAPGGPMAASMDIAAPSAAEIAAPASRSALKLRFILDKNYDTREVYNMLHRDDPAGLVSRAKSMGIGLELAEKIKIFTASLLSLQCFYAPLLLPELKVLLCR